MKCVKCDVRLEPAFIQGATNVYRTRDFIVKQHVGVTAGDNETSVLFSHDTYYVRTKLRDAQYLYLFGNRRRIDGKRMRTAMYSRTYVD